jgi:hypothetical protein
MNNITLILLFLMLLTTSLTEAQHQIIPAPRSYEVSEGELIINGGLELQILSESE